MAWVKEFGEIEANVPVVKATKGKEDLNYDRLEWYAYILKRAITNREPYTAWDACASMMSHFENAFGRVSDEREKERIIDTDFRGR